MSVLVILADAAIQLGGGGGFRWLDLWIFLSCFGLVSLGVFAWKLLVQAPVEVDRSRQRDIASLEAKLGTAIQERDFAERRRQDQVLMTLRFEYLRQFGNPTDDMRAGKAPLPKQWVEDELWKRGETWRRDQYY